MAIQSSIRPSVTLIGAGTQGRRLAYMWGSQGRSVHLIDSQPRQLEDSVAYIEGLRKSSSKPDATAGPILCHSPEVPVPALQDSWLVVEFVPERLALKLQIIAQIESAAPKDTIIASNSSSFTISEIIEGLDLQDASRVLKTPKGPFEQVDVVGLDVVFDIEEHYAQARTGLPTAPREYLRGLIAEGRLGEKNGRGFYDYVDGKKT